MQIVNATVGKIGFIVAGPKHYLNVDILMGQIAVCIAIDNNNKAPSVWLIGEIDDVVAYIKVAAKEGVMLEHDKYLLLCAIDKIKFSLPKHPISRLASALSINRTELAEAMMLANVVVNERPEG